MALNSKTPQNANPSGDQELSGAIFRIDPLVGCSNLLGFSEWINAHCAASHRGPYSLVSLDVNYFAQVNEREGHSGGDAALRWIGIVLAEESQAPVYRIGGDEFVLALMKGSRANHTRLARRIFERLNNEADQFGLHVPAAAMTVIHYREDEVYQPADIFVQLGASMYDVKHRDGKDFKVYQAAEIDPQSDAVYVRWIANLMVERIVTLGGMLDESHRLAYTDPLTELPNLRSAERRLAAMMGEAQRSQGGFSLLLIDGDDLRQYNKISYAAGDAMIRNLGACLGQNLRPGDFLARWRVGDEFLVLLPATQLQDALLVGQRLVETVEAGSRSWPLPVTISIGIAAFPQHGSTPEELLRQAELANERAKAQGKNQVAAA